MYNNDKRASIGDRGVVNPSLEYVKLQTILPRRDIFERLFLLIGIMTEIQEEFTGK
jgi:hypothetical protein